MSARTALLGLVIAVLGLASWLVALRLSPLSDPRLVVSVITLPLPMGAVGELVGLTKPTEPNQSVTGPIPITAGASASPGSFYQEPPWSPAEIEHW